MLGQLFACRFGEPLSIAFRMQSFTVSIENQFTFLPLLIGIGDRVTGVTEKWRPKPSLNADVPHAGLRPRSGPRASFIRWASRQRVVRW